MKAAKLRSIVPTRVIGSFRIIICLIWGLVLLLRLTLVTNLNIPRVLQSTIFANNKITLLKSRVRLTHLNVAFLLGILQF